CGAITLTTGVAAFTSHADAQTAVTVPERDPLQLVAASVERYAAAAMPGVYGGDGIDERAHVVRVLLTGTSHENEGAISANVPVPSLLAFAPSLYSWQQLRAIQQHIQNDHDALAARGIRLTSVGLGLGHIDVGIANTDPASAQKLIDTYGQALQVESG